MSSVAVEINYHELDFSQKEIVSRALDKHEKDQKKKYETTKITKSVLYKLVNTYISKSQDRRTPKTLFDDYNKEFNFLLDPCSSTKLGNSLGVPNYYWYDPDTKEGTDELQQNWSQFSSIFVNPPFRYISKWLEKAYTESLNGCTVVVLAPVKADTKWWHEYALSKADRLDFVQGRVTFDGFTDPFIIGICMIVFNPSREYRF